MSYANVSNNCTFIGRITKEITSEIVGSGDKAFTKIKFTIAAERNMSKAQKEEAKKNNRPTADFVPCEAIGKQADNIMKCFGDGKGKGIMVIASYESYSWDDKNGGGKRYGHRFNVVDFGFPPGNSNGNGGSNNSTNANSSSAPADNNETYPIDDSDIPF